MLGPVVITVIHGLLCTPPHPQAVTCPGLLWPCMPLFLALPTARRLLVDVAYHSAYKYSLSSCLGTVGAGGGGGVMKTDKPPALRELLFTGMGRQAPHV